MRCGEFEAYIEETADSIKDVDTLWHYCGDLSNKITIKAVQYSPSYSMDADFGQPKLYFTLGLSQDSTQEATFCVNISSIRIMQLAGKVSDESGELLATAKAKVMILETLESYLDRFDVDFETREVS